MKNRDGWYNHAYRRNVIDMHITDLDESFLSQFRAEQYVEMLEKVGAQSAVIYTQSHVGLCNYPTKSGEFHKGFKGRDMFKDVSTLCREKGIKVVAYYSILFNNWAVEKHPEWSMKLSDGNPSHITGRYKHACPNNAAYRAFLREQIKEICSYEIDDVRFDMTFWPCVCYCDSCRERYTKETGREVMPEVVDWEDPVWAQFQTKREEWIIDIAKFCTDAVREFAPGVSVEHQVGPVINNWRFGISSELRNEVDFMQADFYGDEMQAMFVNKFLYNITPNPMFGYETSSNLSLQDHTSLKSRDLLKSKLCVSMANGGAFVFIDAIDPVGTINTSVYDVMAQLFEEASVFDKYRGGKMRQDVAIYFCTNSKMDLAQNGTPVSEYAKAGVIGSDLEGSMPHLTASLGACDALSRHHIPFGIISYAQLEELSQFKVIILPEILVMDYDEIEAMRRYVAEGGILYASKNTSLVTKDGVRHDNFLLSDVFGVDFGGKTESDFTYIGPAAKEPVSGILNGVNPKYPLAIHADQMQIRMHDDTKALADIVLPYTNSHDLSVFASIHSNPPGVWNGDAAITEHAFGKGKAYYCTAALESEPHLRTHFADLIKYICKEPLSFESDAHPVVDMTLFEDGDMLRLNLVTFQKVLPNIPLYNICVKVRTDGKCVKAVRHLPEENLLDWKEKEGYVEFVIPYLDTFTMAEIEFC